MTFTNAPEAVATIRTMMLQSREAVVNYMTPLGLAHIMATGHHYGPAPWVRLSRADWSPTYYHKADSLGIGFDRTATGSNAVAQYAAPVRDRYGSLATVPDSLLLWFHHVPWTYRMHSGRTLWDEIAFRYNAGVDTRACDAEALGVRATGRGLGALRRRRALPGHPGARSAVVARCGAHVLPELLADADSGAVRAAGASARVLPADHLSGRIATNLAATRFPDPTSCITARRA